MGSGLQCANSFKHHTTKQDNLITQLVDNSTRQQPVLDTFLAFYLKKAFHVKVGRLLRQKITVNLT